MCHLEHNGGGSNQYPELLCSKRYIVDKIPIGKPRLYKNRDVLHQKYVTEGLSAAQIAKDFLCSKAAVLANLQHFGIPIRERGKHHGHTGNPKYGEKVVKRRTVANLVERKVIGTIVHLRHLGLELKQIAETLSSMGVPTKMHGQRWNRKIIRTILDREEVP